VLNACRALRFAQEGVWSSKPQAGRWAIEHGLAEPEPLRDALAAWRGERSLDRDAADAVLDDLETQLRSVAGGA
jgi:hypothetical protein